MELLQTKVRVTSASRRPASGPGQFIMAKSPDELIKVTVSVDNPVEPLQLKEGDELELILVKKTTGKE